MFLADHRMEQRFERALRRRVGEHAVSHAFAVHGASFLDQSGAEELLYMRNGAAALLGELARDDVSVHDCGAERGEVIRGGALAAADAAGESHHELHNRCKYQRTIGSPQNIATMPASAR